MSHAIDVTDATFAEEVEQSADLTIVDFWAAWCAPCRALSPILEQIATERTGVVRVVKINADENPHTAIRFGVRSLPTMLFFKHGRVVDRIVALVPKSRIEAKIAEHAARPAALTA
jgi:thioredoxin